MVANSIPFNPMATTNFSNSFSITSDGYIQGVAQDDPSVRHSLAGGVISMSETQPMTPGAMIYEDVSGGILINNGMDTLGGVCGRATSIAMATGICVLNQAHHWISSPQSEVPVGFTGTSIHFHRFGSGARIPVAIDPAFATALQNGLITQAVSWDFAAQKIVPYLPVTGQQNITNATYAGGVVTLTFAAAHGYSVGNTINVQGMTPAGYNGDQTIATVPSATTLTYPVATVLTTPASTFGNVAASGGAFPGRILNLAVGNSKIITGPDSNGGYHWSPNGSCALVLI